MTSRLAAALAALAAAVALGLLLGARRAAAAERERELLLAAVGAHVRLVHGELQRLVSALCGPAADVPSPWEQTRGDVNVPTCAALRDHGLEEYYGNLNMLLVEAWLGKVLPALRAEPRPLAASELLTLDADGVLGGAIFVQQLRLGGAAVPAAMMIGIHRLPTHKAMRALLGRAPSANVVEGIVARVMAWCAARRIARLLVCPYQGMRERLQRLGFAPLAEEGRVAPPYAFGATPVAGEMCEDAQLHALDVT